MMNKRISTGIKTLTIAAFIATIPGTLLFDSTVGHAAQKTSAQSQSSATGSTGRERFDFLVRADFFAGYAGDQSALERGFTSVHDEKRTELPVARDRVRALKQRLGF